MIAVLLLGLGLVQFGSDALYGSAAAAGSFPSQLPQSLGQTVYRVLDRIAPAPYVEASLARVALAQGRLADAERSAMRLPASPVRNELLAQCAQARGNHLLALEYYFAAPDVEAVQAEVARVVDRDPAAAYAIESRFRERLITLTTHPDAVADSYWMSGELASRAGMADRALADYRAAAERAPLSPKYSLATANQALTMRRYGDAVREYSRTLGVDPQNPDAIAGLGIVALRRGDRAAAERALLRVRAIDPHAALLAELERELR